MKIRISKQKIGVTELLWLLLAAFLIMKELRAFSGADTKGGLWNIIQLGFMALGFYYLLRKPDLLNNRPLLWFFLYAVMAVLLALPYFKRFTLASIFDFVTIPYGALVLILFYCLGLRTDIEKPTILLWTYYIISLILIVAMQKFHNNGANLDEKGAVADVYYILGLLPLMLLYTPKKWFWLPMLVAMVAIVLSGKRAGMLALIAMLAVYFILELNKVKDTNKRIQYIVMVVVAIFFLYQVLLFLDQKYELRFLERMDSLAEDGGAGRDRIWGRIWELMQSFDFLEILTGRGKGSVRRDVRIEGHNDFLHLMYEHGLLTVSCYILFYISLFHQARAMFRDKYPHVCYFLMSVLFSLFIAMFSFYVIDPSFITCGMLCAGLFMADYTKYRQKQGIVRVKANGY